MCASMGGYEMNQSFYDGVRDNWLVEDKDYQLIGRVGIFAIARLPDYSGEDVVGLFMEDDDIWHLQCTFSSYWGHDLQRVARMLVASKENY